MADPIPPVAGFRFAGVASGIKSDDKKDLGIIVADAPCTAAGVFTRNIVRAAPVEVASQRVKNGKAQAILVNSGNANACTGRRGERAVEDTTANLADALGIDKSLVLPASTGVIGVQMPMEPFSEGIPGAVEELSDHGARSFSEAILTTDRGPKVSSRAFAVGRGQGRVVAIAKGAGMIHPDMATTLAFVLTDVPVNKGFLASALKTATNRTFNCISVDGDTSTNDSIFVMASGALRQPNLTGDLSSSPDSVAFVDALTEVLGDVAQMIVADGEGAERLVEIVVRGAPSERAATDVARTIATSQLVKTAIHGCDPNWGRILAAAGRAGVKFDPLRALVAIGDAVVYERGDVATPPIEQRAAAVMKREKYRILVRLGAGRDEATYWTCDLGHEYVRINADYRT